jgi:hypothetical protein
VLLGESEIEGVADDDDDDDSLTDGEALPDDEPLTLPVIDAVADSETDPEAVFVGVEVIESVELAVIDELPVAEYVAEYVEEGVAENVGESVAEYVGVGDRESVTDGVGDNVGVRDCVLLNVGVTDGVGVLDGDGLAIAYSTPSSAPKYTVPSFAMAAEDWMARPTVCDHNTVGVTSVDTLRARNTPSSLPMNRMPFLSNAADARNASPAVKIQRFTPVDRSIAYKYRDLQPTYTTPSNTTGDASTAASTRKLQCSPPVTPFSRRTRAS